MLAEVVALTERVAKRLRFGAVALVPQHFHSAIMYSRSLAPVDDAFRDELLSLDALLRGREGLSLAQATWALEWGLVIDADSREKIVWHGKVMANVFAERGKQHPIALPARLLNVWSPSRYRLMRREFFARWRAWEQTFPLQ